VRETPELEQCVISRRSVIQGLIIAAVFAKPSAGSTTAGDFISSDSTPKISLYINRYGNQNIPEHRH